MDEGDNSYVYQDLKDPRFSYHVFERIEISNGRGSLGFAAKDAGLQYVKDGFICFASEDSFYVDTFVEIMTQAQFNSQADFVFCDFLFHAAAYGEFHYHIDSQPIRGGIDVSNFIIRKEITNTIKFAHFFKDIGVADRKSVV